MFNLMWEMDCVPSDLNADIKIPTFSSKFFLMILKFYLGE